MKKILFFALLFISPFFLAAQKDSIVVEEASHKDTVKVGIFITSIYSLGFAENDFGVDF